MTSPSAPDFQPQAAFGFASQPRHSDASQPPPPRALVKTKYCQGPAKKQGRKSLRPAEERLPSREEVAAQSHEELVDTVLDLRLQLRELNKALRTRDQRGTRRGMELGQLRKELSESEARRVAETAALRKALEEAQQDAARSEALAEAVLESVGEEGAEAPSAKAIAGLAANVAERKAASSSRDEELQALREKVSGLEEQLREKIASGIGFLTRFEALKM